MALTLGTWVNKVRILFLLTGKTDRKYLVLYLKMDSGGGAKTLKYISCMENMML
jgi:hypothetical protein